MMAEVFESLGADFRVLLLLRNVNDTLLSTVSYCSSSYIFFLKHKLNTPLRTDKRRTLLLQGVTAPI